MLMYLRNWGYSRLGGYEDTNDADRLAVDPAMRQVVGGRAKEHSAASTSQMGRFETEILAQPLVFDHLAREVNEDWSQSSKSLDLCHLSDG